MTDRPTTNEDLQMTLTQIEETLAKAVDPSTLVSGVSAHLGELYNNAEASGNTSAMTAIEQTWENVQSLARSATVNREAYLTAKDIAGTFQTQRDTALKELGDLTKAVEYCDTDHPLINDMVESIVEANNEEAAMWYDEQLEESIYSQLQDVFNYDEEYNEHMEIFLDIFRTNLEVQPNRKREFYAWLKSVKADNEEGDDDE